MTLYKHVFLIHTTKISVPKKHFFGTTYIVICLAYSIIQPHISALSAARGILQRNACFHLQVNNLSNNAYAVKLCIVSPNVPEASASYCLYIISTW